LNHFVIAAWSAKAHNPPTMRTSIKIPIRSFLIALMLALACIIGLVPGAQAVVPAPDGGYAGGNTAEGQNALFSLTTGGYNTAVGFSSLRSDTTGAFNTAVGAGALFANTASENTATGVAALFSNITGIHNTANGVFTLFLNSIGTDNTANGFEALFSNTAGNFNTANGSGALDFNTTGGSNTAMGASALQANTTGNNNTAVGELALPSSTTGSNNVAVGFNAGANVITASNVICVGHPGADVNNSCFIGNIAGVNQGGPSLAVFINTSTGQLGTAMPSSSRRFKHEIKPMDQASEAILGLKPVTFQYKSDKTSTPQFGLIAEEVARVNPDLVVRDKNGEIYTVRYDAVNAMLLNEFLKEHQTVQELKSAAVKQDAMIGQQQKQIDALTTGLQKVSAQLEVSKPAPQTVLNNQ
jgi:hypothetical protein